MRDTRNARALTLAHRLEAIIAGNITAGIRQLQVEQERAYDGPTRGDNTGRSSSTTSSTERNANEVYRLRLMIEDLRDALQGAEFAINHLDRLAEQAKRTRAFGEPDAPEPEDKLPRCDEGQRGRDGAVEWGGICAMSPVKAKLCQTHYMREYRWRRGNGLDPETPTYRQVAV